LGRPANEKRGWFPSTLTMPGGGQEERSRRNDRVGEVSHLLTQSGSGESVRNFVRNLGERIKAPRNKLNSGGLHKRYQLSTRKTTTTYYYGRRKG